MWEEVCVDGGRATHHISTLLVLPWDALRKPRSKEHRNWVRSFDGEVEWSVPTDVAAYGVIFVTKVDEELLLYC